MISDVCIDVHGNGLWRYDDVLQRYFRLQDDGSVSGLIFGRFLPDPEKLWQSRLDAADVARVSRIGQELKPAPATFALWKHWQGVKNADADAKLRVLSPAC